MSEASERRQRGQDRELERECRVFAGYLLGVTPTPYVVDRYRSAHGLRSSLEPAPGFDRLLVRIARTGPLATRVTDAWARLFAPRSPLRNKLVLLTAILEVASPSFRAFDEVDRGPRVVVAARLAAQAALSLAIGLTATLVLLPLRLGARLSRRIAGR